MITTRRLFLGGLAAALAAPAIVKIQNIMPVKNVILLPPKELLHSTSVMDRWGNLVAIVEKFSDWTYAVDGKPATGAEYQQILQAHNYFPNHKGLYRPVTSRIIA